MKKIYLQEFSDNVRTIQSNRPIEFVVNQTDDGYEAENVEFDICVFASTEEKLDKEIQYDMTYIWQEFAEEKDEILDSVAIKLKNLLLATFVEVRKNI